MQLYTHIDIPQADFQIRHTDRVMLIGSCFADEVGEKFVRGGFDAMVNPFGTLYNPASIAALLLRCISERETTEVFQDAAGMWHSWMHHSRFSAPSREELTAKADAATRSAGEFLASADVLIVTLGTAIIYRLKETGMLVANCHKQPDGMFVRERLQSYDIADQWQMLVQLLHSVNPKLRIILTVSPIRHKRDGMHVNQISKGILLQAVDDIIAQDVAGSTGYFPSYEIVLDELRDYRFYAEDMVHPNSVAVEYVWQRFQDTYFDNRTKDAVAKARKAARRAEHRTIIQ